MKSRGFTIIEIVIVLLFVSLSSVLFFTQKSNYDATARDEQRKTTINTIHYSLEEGFLKQYGYYPESISETNLPTVDPALWTDPNGTLFGTPGSNYTYEPASCYQGRCEEYTLKAVLEKESAYIKTNK